jgi:hypothetical protein
MKSRTVITGALVGALAMPMPPARAEMIDPSAGTQRARIQTLAQRDEVRAQLAARGIDSAQLEARIAALSDEEAAVLAERMDDLPAGGRAEALVFALGVVLFVAFIVPVLVIGTGVLLISKAAKTQEGS